MFSRLLDAVHRLRERQSKRNWSTPRRSVEPAGEMNSIVEPPQDRSAVGESGHSIVFVLDLREITMRLPRRNPGSSLHRKLPLLVSLSAR